MIIGKIHRFSGSGFPREMGCGEGQNGTHHKVVSYSSVKETRYRLSVLVCFVD